MLHVLVEGSRAAYRNFARGGILDMDKRGGKRGVPPYTC